MRKKRLNKKLHKFWLQEVLIDASQSQHWRKILFNAAFNKPFIIDKEQLVGISDSTAKTIKRYDLRYRVAKVSSEIADTWLSEGGQVVFKFWCADHQTVISYSGNNPQSI